MEFVAYAGQFKKYVQAVAKISEEARQTVTTDGLVCSAVDMACACMVQAQMDSDIVDFSDEPGTEVGLDMTVLSSICKTVTGSAEVGWTQPNGQIHIRSGRSVHVMSPLPLASLRPIPVPQGWSAQVKVAISGASLREAVLSVKPISDALRFVATPTGVVLSGVGDGREYSLEIPKSDIIAIHSIPVEGEAKTLIGLGYLASEIPLYKSADMVVLSWSHNRPLRVEWGIEPGLDAEMLIAPIMELTDSVGQ